MVAMKGFMKGFIKPAGSFSAAARRSGSIVRGVVATVVAGVGGLSSLAARLATFVVVVLAPGAAFFTAFWQT